MTNYNTKVVSTEFQAIMKKAHELYKKLPWWKRLFGLPFCQFKGNDITEYNG